MEKNVTLVKGSSVDWQELPGGLKYRLVAVGSRFSTGIASAQPGAGETWHKHTEEVEESYYVVKGEGRLTWKSGSETRTLEFAAGDAMYLPYGLENTFVNTGKDELLIIFTITNAAKSRE